MSERGAVTVPGDVGGVEDGQALVILQVGEAEIFLETQDFGVADIGTVKKRAKEKESEDGDDPVCVRWFDGCQRSETTQSDR